MIVNQKLLNIAFAILALQFIAILFGHHFFMHSGYVLVGLALGMIFGRLQKRPKLKKTKFSVENCKIDPSGKAIDTSCTVVVMRQYCYIIDTPSPQQICYWVREEHKGRWNAENGCCEAFVDGRLVCVSPR